MSPLSLRTCLFFFASAYEVEAVLLVPVRQPSLVFLFCFSLLASYTLPLPPCMHAGDVPPFSFCMHACAYTCTVFFSLLCGRESTYIRMQGVRRPGDGGGGGGGVFFFTRCRILNDVLFSVLRVLFLMCTHSLSVSPLRHSTAKGSSSCTWSVCSPRRGGKLDWNGAKRTKKWNRKYTRYLHP